MALPLTHSRVDATAARTHIAHLLNAGGDLRLIGWLSGLGLNQVREIASNLLTIRHHEQVALLAIVDKDLDSVRPRWMVSDVVRELTAAGVPRTWLNAELEADTKRLPIYVPTEMADKAWQLYKAWLDGTLRVPFVKPIAPPPKDAEHPFSLLASVLEERAQQPWRERAACKPLGPDPWFAEDIAVRRQADQLCNTCPVEDECFNSLNDVDVVVRRRKSRQQMTAA